MALNDLTLDVTTGLQGAEFRSKINGLTAGSVVTLGSNTAVIGGGVLNSFLVHPSLPFELDANVFEIIERVPTTGETKTTRVSVTGTSRRTARLAAVAALTGGRTERATRFGGSLNGNGSMVWSVIVEDDYGADHSTAIGTPAPAWSVQPSISGTATQGQTLTGSDGTIVGGTVSARAWLRDGVAISGATSTTYVLVLADVGAVITYRVTATGAGGSASATSAGTSAVAADIPFDLAMNVRHNGSSTLASAGISATADGRGNTVPSSVRPISGGGSAPNTYEARISALVTSSTGKTVTNISIPSAVGNKDAAGGSNGCIEDIRQKIVADIGTAITASTIVISGTPNRWTAYATTPPATLPETTKEFTDQVKSIFTSLDAVGCPHIFLWTFLIHGSDGNSYSAEKIRLEKLGKERGPRLKTGVYFMDEVCFRNDPPQAVQDDINARATKHRAMGWTNGADYPHSNGGFYTAAAPYELMLLEAASGRLPTISPFNYKADYMTGAGKIATIVTMGEVQGCTFTIDDSTNFALQIVDNPSYPGADQPIKILELHLTAAGYTNRATIGAPKDLNITVSKSGYGTQTHRISTALTIRNPASNVPLPVTVRQAGLFFMGQEDDPARPYFANSAVFTFIAMVRTLPCDGLQLMFKEAGSGVGYLTNNPAAGSSDAIGGVKFFTLEKAPGTPSFSIERTGGNNIRVYAEDSAGTQLFGTQGTQTAGGRATLTQDDGWRMIYVCIDLANPANCKLALGPGRSVSTGLSYSESVTTLTPAANNGLIGLGQFRAMVNPGTTVGHVDSYSQMRLFQGGTALPSPFIPWDVWRVIATPDMIQYLPGNVSQLWTPASGTGPVAAAALGLGGGGSTITRSEDSVDVNFQLDLRGCAAEWASGGDDTAWTDIPNGQRKVKNFGWGDDLNITPDRPLLNATP
jgi:hypothetical protein